MRRPVPIQFRTDEALARKRTQDPVIQKPADICLTKPETRATSFRSRFRDLTLVNTRLRPVLSGALWRRGKPPRPMPEGVFHDNSSASFASCLGGWTCRCGGRSLARSGCPRLIASAPHPCPLPASGEREFGDRTLVPRGRRSLVANSGRGRRLFGRAVND